jgi:hypothetical protein
MNKTQLKLLQKSIDNIHYQQILKKVNIESEIYWNNQTIGSPMQNHTEYLKGLGANFLKAKQEIKFLL